MTEEELKQAAIELCIIRGIDPDREILQFYTDNEGESVARHVKQWESYIFSIKTHNEIQTAITKTERISQYNKVKDFMTEAREQAENDE